MNTAGVEPIHIAVQYLAAAGISFLDKKEDDSHTNLGFSVERQHIVTRPLNDAGDQLALRLPDFALLWINDSSITQYALNHRQHHEILSWIRSVLKPSGLADRYRYEFHYSLPYDVADNYMLETTAESLQKESKLRSLAQGVIRQVIQEYSMDSEIRIWPHHFDTGAYAQLPGNKNISIGMGLAIPDSVVDDHYFYLSGYRGNKPVDTISFESLTMGKWARKDFQGAVLAAGDISEENALLFFQQGIAAYANN